MDNIKRIGVSVVLAAVACAGCVGWSFLHDVLAQRQQGVRVPVTVPR